MTFTITWTRRKTIISIVVAVVFCVIILKFALISDSEKIKQTLYNGKNAIEQENIHELMPCISRNYIDENGFNYIKIKYLFNWLFSQFDDIRIHIRKMDINIDREKNATATLHTWATAKGLDTIGYIVGDKKEPCRVIFTLVEEGDRFPDSAAEVQLHGKDFLRCHTG